MQLPLLLLPPGIAPLLSLWGHCGCPGDVQSGVTGCPQLRGERCWDISPRPGAMNELSTSGLCVPLSCAAAVGGKVGGERGWSEGRYGAKD